MLPSPTYRPLTLHHKGDCLMSLSATKHCNKCSTSKPLTDFYKHASQKNGLQQNCKVCDRKRAKVYHAANAEKVNATSRNWQAANPGYAAASSAAYKAEHPERIQAKDAVNYAIKKGELIRPEDCSACGVQCKPQGHHGSYAEKDRLDVVWLCRSCHKRLHAQMDRKGISL